MGHWLEFKANVPRRLKHPWKFAFYYETPSERDDKLWYEAFLFRNEERSVFGIKEQVGAHPMMQNRRAMARQVISNTEFRNSLVSTDPDLPRMWKKH
jgi:hypothetical protein